MSHTSHTLGIPWRLQFFKNLNGYHPLVASFIDRNSGVTPVEISFAAGAERHLHSILQSREQATASLPQKQKQDYLAWSNAMDQCAIDARGADFDTLFLHTTPLYHGTKPWIFHFESFPSLFHPFFFTGKIADVNLRETEYFKKVKAAFESDQCRAIFTHMKSSLQIAANVFDSPKIAAKLRLVRLGIESRAQSQILPKFSRQGKIRILFTNSHHNDAGSFYIRGGHNLLKAFHRIRQENKHVELTILSSLPKNLGICFSLEEFEGVSWLRERVSDAEMTELYLKHHIFALPSACLHSYSLLNAMSHGCVPIVTDALGYEEYVMPVADSVMQIKGVRDQVYRNQSGGWIADNCVPFSDWPSDGYVDQIYQLLTKNLDLATLQAKAVRNHDFCTELYSLAASHLDFNEMLASLHSH
jgi:glycosyltransferase involved in cell wall biosynthesis